MISAGQLTEPVTFQRMAYLTSDSGEQRVSFEDYYTTRAAVKYSKIGRNLTAGEMWDPTQIVVTIRYCAKADVCRRVRWRGRYYTMTPPNADRVNGTMTITAELWDEGAGSGVQIVQSVE